jgi:aconitase A
LILAAVPLDQQAALVDEHAVVDGVSLVEKAGSREVEDTLATAGLLQRSFMKGGGLALRRSGPACYGSTGGKAAH